MSAQAPTADWLDVATPDIDNLLNVALDTLERVREAGITGDPTLSADVADTIGQLEQAIAARSPDPDPHSLASVTGRGR